MSGVTIMGNSNGPKCHKCGRKIAQGQRVRVTDDGKAHAYTADCPASPGRDREPAAPAVVVHWLTAELLDACGTSQPDAHGFHHFPPGDVTCPACLEWLRVHA